MSNATPTLRFHRFDPGPCGFPRPRVPVLPPLTRDQITLRAAPADGIEQRHYARGRYALRAAYELVGVGPQGALLAPAYHCRTMLDGAVRLGAEVVLYPLTPELDPDRAGLERVAAAARTQPVALLFTHYFGLPRDIGPTAAWCRERGIALIEDCSHALVGHQPTDANGAADGTGASSPPAATGAPNGPDGTNGHIGRAAPAPPAATPMGRTGRYAASSPYKFHPCPDGGLLWSPQGAPLPPQGASPGLRAELRGLWLAGRQLGTPHKAPEHAAIEPELAALAPRIAIPGRDWIEADPAPALSYDYAPGDETAASLAVSRWIQRHTDVQALLERRRAHYAQWAEAVRGLPGCRALFAELPAGSTPYMFPLQVDDPPRRFYPLKQLGVPIWRWDDMAVSDCAVSQRYRQGVFHLPCHQALDEAQMRWMTAAVRQVMRG